MTTKPHVLLLWLVSVVLLALASPAPASTYLGKEAAGKYNIGVDESGNIVFVPVQKGAGDVIETGIPFETVVELD